MRTFNDSSFPIRPAGARTADDFLFAHGFNEALIFGDPLGAAFLAVSHARGERETAAWAGSPPAAQRVLASRLATLEAADAAAIAAIERHRIAAAERAQDRS